MAVTEHTSRLRLTVATDSSNDTQATVDAAASAASPSAILRLAQRMRAEYRGWRAETNLDADEAFRGTIMEGMDLCPFYPKDQVERLRELHDKARQLAEQ